MFVAASTDCFPNLALDAALSRLVDLEFTRVEIAIREGGAQLTPSQVHADLEGAIAACRNTQRLTPVAFSVDIPGDGSQYFDQFRSCCKLAKATKVVSVTVPSAELGTPFNAEIERLRELVRIATLEGVVVGLRTELGKVSQDPDTAVVLCDHVKGLSITLDPSPLVMGPGSKVGLEKLIDHVSHVQLRDTSKTRFQVRVGQGEIEYGRLVALLGKAHYNRALSIHIVEEPDSGIDHLAELRKLRLLLESLL